MTLFGHHFQPRDWVPPAHWRRPLTALVVLELVLLCAYFPTLSAMVGIWSRSDTFAHAFLVAPISLWLVWRKRAELAPLSPRPQFALLPVMAVTALFWWVGQLAGVNALTQFAFTALLVLAVPMLLGWQVAWTLLFPLTFLFFMVPFGEFVMPTMMRWTADVTVFALQLLGIPVFREGLQFVIPTGSWSVVEACSGVRYLIASFLVGSLFAYLNYRSTGRRVLFALVSLLLPVAANWARAVIIVLLGHFTDNKLAAGADHLIYGWVFFGLVIGLMFFIGGRWAQFDPTEAVAAAAPGPVAASDGRFAWAFAGALLLCAVAPVLHWQQSKQAWPALVLVAPELPGAQRVDQPPAFSPVFEGPRAEGNWTYEQEGQRFTLHVAYYHHQGFGRKLVSSANVLTHSEDKTWASGQTGVRPYTVAELTVPMLAAELRQGHVGVSALPVRLQVRQVVWVAGRWQAPGVPAALVAVLQRLSGRADDAAAVTFTVEQADSVAGQKQLDLLLRRHIGTVSDWLGTVRPDK